MASNNINWLGNRVFDPNSTRQAPRNTQQEEQRQPQRNMQTEEQQQMPRNPQMEEQWQIPGGMQEEEQPRTPGRAQTEEPQQVPRPALEDDFMRPPLSSICDRQGPPPVFDREYVPGFLMENIGKNIRAEFIFGNFLVDKVGKLIEVGVNYFVLDDVNSRTHIMCDLYSVKFVTIIVS